MASTRPISQKVVLITRPYCRVEAGGSDVGMPAANRDKQTAETNGAIKEESIMRDFSHHNLNALHIYCRLVKILPKRQAWGIISFWERTRLYALMYA
jgi:hypothetical protein